jgi:hypothetical protein
MRLRRRPFHSGSPCFNVARVRLSRLNCPKIRSSVDAVCGKLQPWPDNTHAMSPATLPSFISRMPESGKQIDFNPIGIYIFLITLLMSYGIMPPLWCRRTCLLVSQKTPFILRSPGAYGNKSAKTFLIICCAHLIKTQEAQIHQSYIIENVTRRMKPYSERPEASQLHFRRLVL